MDKFFNIHDMSLSVSEEFSHYFGMRKYNSIKESQWYRKNPIWLADCLDNECSSLIGIYDTAACDKVVASIMKLLNSESPSCNLYGMTAANSMMRIYYANEGHSEYSFLKNEYIVFISELSDFLRKHSSELPYIEETKYSSKHHYVFAINYYNNIEHTDKHVTYYDFEADDIGCANQHLSEFITSHSNRFGYYISVISEDGKIIFSMTDEERMEYEALKLKYSELNRYIELKKKYEH